MNSKITHCLRNTFNVGDVIFNHTSMKYEIIRSVNSDTVFTVSPAKWYERLRIKAKILWSYLRKKVMQMNSKCGKGGKKGGKGK